MNKVPPIFNDKTVYTAYKKGYHKGYNSSLLPYEFTDKISYGKAVFVKPGPSAYESWLNTLPADYSYLQERYKLIHPQERKVEKKTESKQAPNQPAQASTVAAQAAQASPVVAQAAQAQPRSANRTNNQTGGLFGLMTQVWGSNVQPIAPNQLAPGSITDDTPSIAFTNPLRNEDITLVYQTLGANFYWPDQDERPATEQDLSKLTDKQWMKILPNMMAMAKDVYETLNPVTGALDAMTEDERYDFAFSLIAKGRQMYDSINDTHEFALYLFDQYQPMFSMLKKKLNFTIKHDRIYLLLQ